MAHPLKDARELRQAYIKLYSQERVTWASKRASGHKSRAQKLGRTEHFTAWEWLDLCAASAFGCHYCEEAEPLEVHHRKDLWKGGSNTIENIVALCERCHIYWHDCPHEIGEVWLMEQQKLLDAFQEGDYVRRGYRRYADERCLVRLPLLSYPFGPRPVGIITQLFPAQTPSPTLPPWRGFISHYCNGQINYSGGKHSKSPFQEVDVAWEQGGAKALVHWLRTVEGAEVVVSELLIDLLDLRGLRKIEKPSAKKK